MTPSPPDPSLPGRLRAFNELLPLAGDSPNAVLSLSDDDAPVPASAMPPEEWQGILILFRPHRVYPLMGYRLRAWPEDGQV